MSNFVSPRFQALGLDGKPLPGAMLYTYDNGTTDQRNVYADAALTTPLAWPLTADSNGVFPRFFLDTSAYSVEYRDAADNILWSADGVEGALLNDSSVRLRLQQAACNPLDYGAIGDGVANEYTPLLAAVVYSSRVIDLLGKTFRCDSQLSLYGSKTLRNGKLNFSYCGDTTWLSFAGGTATPKGPLTADAYAGDMSVACSDIRNVYVGDWVHLTAAAAGANWDTAGNKWGEILQVASVTAGVGNAGTLGFAMPLACDYRVALNPAVFKLANTVFDLVLEDVTIVGSNVGNTATALKLDRCQRVSLRNVTFDGTQLSAVDVLTSADVSMRDCKFYNSNAIGYGVRVGGCSRRVVLEGCSFRNVAMPVEVGTLSVGFPGITQDVTIRTCSLLGPASTKACVDILSTSLGVIVADCNIAGSPVVAGYGVRIAGARVVIDKCAIQSFDGQGIRVVQTVKPSFTYSSLQNNVHIRDCNISKLTGSCIYLATQANAMPMYGVLINGCELYGSLEAGLPQRYGVEISVPTSEARSIRVESCTFYACRLKASTAGTGILSQVAISRNAFATVNSSDIVVLLDGSAGTFRYVTVDGNTFDCDCAEGIKCLTVAKINIRGNVLKLNTSNSTYGIDCQHCDGLIVADNWITNKDVGVYVISEYTTAIRGNTIIDSKVRGIHYLIQGTQIMPDVSENKVAPYSSATDGIWIDSQGNQTDSIRVSGNIVNRCKNPLSINGSFRGGAIVGNCLTGDGTTPIIVLTGAITVISGLAVSSNAFYLGTYGISAVSNCANCLADGNVHHTMSSGRINGAGFTEGDQVAF